MSDEPLISCLMVALPVPWRFAGLKRSIACYLGQAHVRRELVIVIDNQGEHSTAAAIIALVASLGREDIRIIEVTGHHTLGALRNISMAAAHGEVFCQWDDDDLHHPERLQRQFVALVQSGGEGLCLQQVMQFYPAARELYCINFHLTGDGVFAGSLMCWTRSPIAYPETGEFSELGEDSAVVTQLKSRAACRVLSDEPHLYVYVSHGANTWDMQHHIDLSARGWSKGLLRRHEPALRAGLAPFDFGPGPVTVRDRNGPVFTID